ncbi:MAG: hypothetical protein HPZ91_09070 [Lentisphaeria bacterium]|nr:hypothetical protein [Lentisphaeria bacterium]
MSFDKESIQGIGDDELDAIVGGSLNQSVIAQHGLKSNERNGKQILYAKVEWAFKTSAVSAQGMQIESSLNKLYQDPGVKSVSFETNNGGWVSFSREQLGALLKG